MIAGVTAPRLLAWGMTSFGLGLGLIVAAFVGEDTPIMAIWGAALLVLGAFFTTTYYMVRNRRDGQ